MPRLTTSDQRNPHCKFLIRETFVFSLVDRRAASPVATRLHPSRTGDSSSLQNFNLKTWNPTAATSEKVASRNGESMRTALATDASFAERACLPDLMSAQNPDGGWGFRSGQNSAIEPTSWGVLAMCGLNPEHPLSRKRLNGAHFLRQKQLSDGSWAAVAGDETGDWTTSLACLALHAVEGSTPELHAARNWLCRSWPGEGGIWWRIRHRLFGQPQLISQNHRLRGWSWTPGTSSWVEPTAHALLALRAARGSASFLARVDRRCNLAQKMLCNRMCVGGGWNCGNPVVYGTAGSPLIGATCWALLALGESAQHPDVRRCLSESLAWIERTYLETQGPGSLALAYLCLKAFGRSASSIDSPLSEMYDHNRFLGQVPALAWALLATQPVPRWLQPATFESN